MSGLISVNKARVSGVDRCKTKTGDDRRVQLCPRALVSWNLMVGKNVLWVAKQHGHSIVTMLRIYAAWAEGAVEAGDQAIDEPHVDSPRVACSE